MQDRPTIHELLEAVERFLTGDLVPGVLPPDGTVPEPATLVLMLTGLIALGLRRRRG